MTSDSGSDQKTSTHAATISMNDDLCCKFKKIESFQFRTYPIDTKLRSICTLDQQNESTLEVSVHSNRGAIWHTYFYATSLKGEINILNGKYQCAVPVRGSPDKASFRVQQDSSSSQTQDTLKIGVFIDRAYHGNNSGLDINSIKSLFENSGSDGEILVRFNLD